MRNDDRESAIQTRPAERGTRNGGTRGCTQARQWYPMAQTVERRDATSHRPARAPDGTARRAGDRGRGRDPTGRGGLRLHDQWRRGHLHVHKYRRANLHRPRQGDQPVGHGHRRRGRARHLCWTRRPRRSGHDDSGGQPGRHPLRRGRRQRRRRRGWRLRRGRQWRRWGQRCPDGPLHDGQQLRRQHAQSRPACRRRRRWRRRPRQRRGQCRQQ